MHRRMLQLCVLRARSTEMSLFTVTCNSLTLSCCCSLQYVNLERGARAFLAPSTYLARCEGQPLRFHHEPSDIDLASPGPIHSAVPGWRHWSCVLMAGVPQKDDMDPCNGTTTCAELWAASMVLALFLFWTTCTARKSPHQHEGK